MSDAAKSSEPQVLSRPRRVLVVDDNEDNRDMLSRRLKRKGFTAVTAEGGEAALAALDKESFDVVILDVMMPDIDGLTVLGKIREKHSKTELPVIMATARSDSADVVGALERGANDYVTKPIDLPILVARIKVHLGTKDEAAQKAPVPAQTPDVSQGLGAGTIIDGRYEVRELLGEGGFAAVHRAIQLSTGQAVALKYARPERAHSRKFAGEVARFMREMKLLAKIKHPHIVRLIDSGTLVASHAIGGPTSAAPQRPSGHSEAMTKVEGADGTTEEAASSNGQTSVTRETGKTRESAAIRDTSETREKAPATAVPETLVSGAGKTTEIRLPYIVMDLLEGESFAEYIDRKAPLKPSRAISLMLPILDGLDTAHREGVVHRDIKPANIILVRRGEETEPRIVDFGIAKLLEPEADEITLNESFVGTPAYMAPEQGRGKPPPDARADQFAAAAMLYHAVTGQKLYTATSFFEVLHAVTQAEFARPTAIRPDLDPAFEHVLLKALSRERDDRYPTALEFGRALLSHASPRTRRQWAHRFETDDETSEGMGVNPLAATARMRVPGGLKIKVDEDEAIEDEASVSERPPDLKNLTKTVDIARPGGASDSAPPQPATTIGADEPVDPNEATLRSGAVTGPAQEGGAAGTKTPSSSAIGKKPTSPSVAVFIIAAIILAAIVVAFFAGK